MFLPAASQRSLDGLLISRRCFLSIRGTHWSDCFTRRKCSGRGFQCQGEAQGEVRAPGEKVGSRGMERCTRKLYWKRFFITSMQMRAISRGVGFRRLGVCLAVLLTACGPLAGHGQQATTSVASIESLIRSQEYDQALQATRSKLSETPGDFRVWTLQGIIFSLKDNSAEALTAFDHALRISPTYMPALKGEVQLLYQAGDKRAIPLLERIVKADPSDKTAHEMLAMLEKKQADCQRLRCGVSSERRRNRVTS